MTFGSNGGFGTTGGNFSPDPGIPQPMATPANATPVVHASEGTGILTTVGWILAALAVILALGVGGAMAVNAIGGGGSGDPAPAPGIVDAPREPGSPDAPAEPRSPGAPVEPVPEPQPEVPPRPGVEVEDV